MFKKIFGKKENDSYIFSEFDLREQVELLKNEIRRLSETVSLLKTEKDCVSRLSHKMDLILKKIDCSFTIEAFSWKDILVDNKCITKGD